MSRLVLLVFTILALVAPSIQFTHFAEDSCTIIGDADVYGIGVRISYYLAFFSGTIALAFSNKNAMNDAKKGNAIIGFVVLIILIRNAVQGSLAIFEFWIVFNMSFLLLGGAFASLILPGDLLSSVALFTVYGLYSVVMPWIFFALKDQGRKDGCELKAFCFAYFSFFNVHWIGFLKFVAVSSCIVGSIMILVGLCYGAWEVARVIMKRKNKEKEVLEEKTQREVRDVEKVMAAALSCLTLPSGIIAIVFNEKMISGNDIDMSDSKLISTSQLIPFLVGVIGLVSTTWTVTRDRIYEAADNETAEEENRENRAIRGEREDETAVKTEERDMEKAEAGKIEEQK